MLISPGSDSSQENIPVVKKTDQDVATTPPSTPPSTSSSTSSVPLPTTQPVGGMTAINPAKIKGPRTEEEISYYKQLASTPMTQLKTLEECTRDNLDLKQELINYRKYMDAPYRTTGKPYIFTMLGFCRNDSVQMALLQYYSELMNLLETGKITHYNENQCKRLYEEVETLARMMNAHQRYPRPIIFDSKSGLPDLSFLSELRKDLGLDPKIQELWKLSRSSRG